MQLRRHATRADEAQATGGGDDSAKDREAAELEPRVDIFGSQGAREDRLEDKEAVQRLFGAGVRLK